MNTFLSVGGARFDRPKEGGPGRSVLRLAPAFSAGEDQQHDVVDEPDDVRVEVDYFLVGMAPKAETDGEMSLARAAGLATQCQGKRRPLAGHPLRRDQHARPPLLVPGRSLVSPPRDAVEDVVGLLIGAPGRMVGGEVLQERLGVLALRRRKVLGESGLVHLTEQVEKAAAELSVELIGQRPLFLRRRCLLRGRAEPRGVIRQPPGRERWRSSLQIG